MSRKSKDAHDRWRSITVGFRLSPEESAQLNREVAFSGLTKQDYILSRLKNQDITVYCTPKVHRALKLQLAEIHCELERLTHADEISEELQDLLRYIGSVLVKMEEVTVDA